MSTSATESGKPKNEIASLTGIRGIAAVYVVLFHYFAVIPLTSPLLCFFGHGYLAVDLFFVLSGFVMALTNVRLFSGGVQWQSVRRFASRRIARIYPLYLFSLALTIPLSFRAAIYWHGGSRFAALLPNALLVQNWFGVSSFNDPSWSISAEAFAYCLFPGIVTLAFFRSRHVFRATALLALIAICGLYIFFLQSGQAITPLDRTAGFAALVRCVGEFTLGICTYRCTQTRVGQAALRTAWLTYAATFAILVLLAFRRSDLAVALLFAPLILSLAGEPSLVSRFLGSRPIEYLGQLSFSIYLLHVPVQPVIHIVEKAALRFGYAHGHVYGVVAALPLLLLVSQISYTVIEKPGRTLIRSRLEA